MDAPGIDTKRRSLVKAMWAVAGSAEQNTLPGVVAPDSHVEFVIHLGEPWRMRRADSPSWSVQPKAFVYAQSHGALRFAGEGTVSVIAFRVSPVVAAHLLRRPVTELWNLAVSLRDLIGDDSELLLEQLGGVPAGERCELLWRWIERRLGGWGEQDWKAESIFSHLLWRATDSIDATARQLGWSTRSLRRLFAERATLSPKEVQLAGRHLQACALLRERPDLDVTDIAARLGFSDHAAFTHSFRERLGLTPTGFRAEPFAFYEKGC
jgi:AraC-like DNA-binding protein